WRRSEVQILHDPSQFFDEKGGFAAFQKRQPRAVQTFRSRQGTGGAPRPILRSEPFLLKFTEVPLSLSLESRFAF
ncbi:MAG: hypothetical protein SVU32_09430, partial [Candidatus Nanohaloarchaea archaeon]|nr:hypothetical protein [Candidatus Nanohaloarchaea archaeon]